MDPITHLLTGPVLSKSGFHQKLGWPATIALCVSVSLPDIDVFLSLEGAPFSYLRYHRGFTHSFLGGVVLALMVSGAICLASRSKKMGSLFFLSLLGIYTHIFLDLITSFGTQILWPFSNRYSLYWVFIVDPWMTGGLLLAVILAWKFSTRSALVSKMGILFLTGYILTAGISHGVAERRIHRELRDQKLEVARYAVVPQPFSFLNWMGLAENGDSVLQTRFSLFTPGPLSFSFYPQPKGKPFLEKLEGREEVQLFRWFSDFPIVTELPQPNGDVLVEYFDLKFDTVPERRPFLLKVLVSDTGEVKSVSLK